MTTIAVFHPSSELYGADRILVNALKALPDEVKKRVYLLSEGPLVKFLTEEVSNVTVVVKDKMPVIYRKIFTPIGIFRFCYYWLKFITFIRKEHKKYQFQSAYLNTLSTSFILPIMKWIALPCFIHVHEIIESPKLIGSITTRLSARYAKKVICVSGAVLDGMQLYSSKITKKAVVLHNGIAPIEVEKRALSATLRCYLFGRIMPKKGQWFLIEALEKIPKLVLHGHKIILMGGVLKGQEHLKSELASKINLAGLNNIVQLEDFASDISEAMNQADICLVPSQMKDPFPTTVLEAMSAGKPVIATNHGGAREAILDGETGYLVTPSDPQLLADRITMLITDADLVEKMGTAARKHFEDRFTLDHFNKNWLAFNKSDCFI